MDMATSDEGNTVSIIPTKFRRGVVRSSEIGSEQDMIRVGGVVPVEYLWN